MAALTVTATVTATVTGDGDSDWPNHGANGPSGTVTVTVAPAEHWQALPDPQVTAAAGAGRREPLPNFRLTGRHALFMAKNKEY